MTNKIQLFENKKVRSHWDADEEEWYWSVVDVCGVLTEQKEQRGATFYWGKLKQRLKFEGCEVLTNCQHLKMPTAGGLQATDAMKTADILRIIQSIPSKKAEPFKVWLAQLGSERLDEMADPEKAIDRGLSYYQKKGYSEEWIKERMRSKVIRAELTDAWDEHGIVGNKEYAILTDEILKSWSGKTTKQYKEYKNLTKEELRDNMSRMELLLTMLGEEATKDIVKQNHPQGFDENKNTAQKGGSVAKAARDQYEKQLGHSMVTPLNFREAKQQRRIKQGN